MEVYGFLFNNGAMPFCPPAHDVSIMKMPKWTIDSDTPPQNDNGPARKSQAIDGPEARTVADGRPSLSTYPATAFSAALKVALGRMTAATLASSSL